MAQGKVQGGVLESGLASLLPILGGVGFKGKSPEFEGCEVSEERGCPRFFLSLALGLEVRGCWRWRQVNGWWPGQIRRAMHWGEEKMARMM